MIAHKAKMARHGAEAVPAWKGSDLDDETGESASFFDVGINRCRELLKVGLLKLGLRSHIQNRMRLVECVFDHLFAPMTNVRLQPLVRQLVPYDFHSSHSATCMIVASR